MIADDGIIIQRDFNFPLSGENFIKSYVPIWNDITSQTNVERLPRLVLYSPFLVMAMLGVSMPSITQVLIIAAFSFLTVSMYWFLQALLQLTGSGAKERSTVFLILCSLIFAYNPVTFYFAHTISLLISLGALPLLLYFILTRLKSFYFPLLAALSIALSLAHPFTFIMNLIIGVAFIIFMYVRCRDARLIATRLACVALILPLVFAWFLLPFFYNPSTSTDLGREGHLNRDVFQRVSDNSLFKIIILERERYTYVNTEPPDTVRKIVHYASLATLVGISFFPFFVRQRRRQVILLSMFAVGFSISALLSMGMNGPLGEPYYQFISDNDQGWIFRSPLKFQLYQAFFIVPLFLLAIVMIHERLRRVSQHAATLIAVFVLVGSAAYAIFDANVFSFRPISFPEEYFEINQLIDRDNEESKVVYYPLYDEFPTTWSQRHHIAPFEAKSSPIETYEIFYNYNHVKYMLHGYPYYSGLFQLPDFTHFLKSIGIKYIVFHDDMENRLSKINLERLQSSSQLRSLYDKNGWYLFEILNSDIGHIRAVDQIAIVADDRQTYRFSSPDVAVISQSDVDNKKIEPASSMVKLKTEKDRVVPSSENLLLNPRFEEWVKNGTDVESPNGWSVNNDVFTLHRGADEIGNNHLRIDSLLAGNGSSSLVTSNPISVESGSKYLFQSDLKTSNTFRTHLKVQGYNLTSGSWTDASVIISNLNGDNNWKTYWKTYDIPNDIIALRLVINSGNPLDYSRGQSSTYVDNIGVYQVSERSLDNEYTIAYEKITPTLLNVNISVSKPSVLILPETFDRGWIATTNTGERFENVRIYGMISGFYLDKAGKYNLDIKYEPQEWFTYGLIISSITVASYLIVGLFRKKLRRLVDYLPGAGHLSYETKHKNYD